ncbi:hypothetical protein JXA31_00010 [Candidatus Bathyarchaeota archaeon]|nr:hypothetical protein [Candidatus Bathyarchaeota archaeon]
MYEEIRITIEAVSAIMCFILLRFMIKPYEITGESRYIGLPLGFGFLGATYVLSAVTYYLQSQMPIVFLIEIFYIQLIARTFAFLFIAITYYFSKKPTEKNRLLWKITLTLLIALFITSFLISSIPDVTLSSYIIARNCLRVIDLIIILYICIHVFRSHIEKPDPKTIWIPLGYIVLLVSQYSALFFQLDGSFSALFAALILRLVFLSIFIVVSFMAFYKTENGE